MALCADVDVRAVGERGRCGEAEIICGRDRIAELIRLHESREHVRPDMSLVRIMTDRARDADVGVIGDGDGGILAVNQGESRRT